MAHDIEQRLLVLRSMAAVRSYLDDYPIAPREDADCSWLNLSDWLIEGDDCDEERFALAVRLGYPAVRLRHYDERGAADAITPELARRLRATRGLERLKLIAITGYGQPSDRERSAAAGFDEHLVKPVSIEAVQAAIDRLTGS